MGKATYGLVLEAPPKRTRAAGGGVPAVDWAGYFSAYEADYRVGEWARLVEYGGKTTAVSTASMLRKMIEEGEIDTPEGHEWQIKTAKFDNGSKVFIRLIDVVADDPAPSDDDDVEIVEGDDLEDDDLEDDDLEDFDDESEDEDDFEDEEG